MQPDFETKNLLIVYFIDKINTYFMANPVTHVLSRVQPIHHTHLLHLSFISVLYRVIEKKEYMQIMQCTLYKYKLLHICYNYG